MRMTVERLEVGDRVALTVADFERRGVFLGYDRERRVMFWRPSFVRTTAQWEHRCEPTFEVDKIEEDR